MAKQTTSNGARNDGSRTATDTLRDAGGELLGAVMQRATSAATDRIGDFSDRLTNVSENGESLRSLVRRPGREDRGDDEGDDVEEGGKQGGSSGIGSALGGLKEKVQGLFGGGKGGQGGKKKLKLTNMVETLDVGVPLRTTYDLWTQFTDFSTFMKKVENVDQPSDEKTHWKAQVFLSHREWEATIIEQVPDSHIVWRSKGAKGHVDGAVSFTGLGPNLTRVTLVMEYFPQGLFERTGNLWRAQGRRARLEFKHFRRHAMTQALLHPDEIEGWRGEIHDSEVVKTNEEALEEEQEASGRPQDEPDYAEESDEVEPSEDGEAPEEDYDTAAVGEDEDFAEDEDLEPDEDEDVEPDEEDAYDDDAYDDEAEDAGYDQAPEDEGYEDEEEPPTRRRGRRPVGAGRGRRGANS
jgi:hypothetical protein